jgi:hypothetical protein
MPSIKVVKERVCVDPFAARLDLEKIFEEIINWTQNNRGPFNYTISVKVTNIISNSESDSE